MKYLFNLLLLFTVLVFPVNALADRVVPDNESVVSDDVSTEVIARPRHVNPGPPGVRPNHNKHHINPGHHYYAPRYYPRRYYNPVVVYSNEPSTTIVENEPVVTTLDGNSHVGFGIRGVVATNSPMNDISANTSGGVGLYLTVRPVRYFSVEFVNDYLFGTLKYDDNSFSQGYVKIPFSVGARVHFLDYGNTDVYLAAAASISAWSYTNEYDSYYYDWYYDEYYYTSEVGVQFGGQFGAGVNYISNSFEIGLDLRYTVESIPDYIPGYYNYRYDSDSVVHGFLLAINIGFYL